MKKRTFAALALGGILLCSAAACSPGGSGKSVTLWVYGDSTTMAAYNAMRDEFNKTVGKEEGITIKVIPKPESNYETLLTNGVTSNSGPDIFALSDRYFKKYVDYCEPLDDYIKEGSLEDLYPSTVERYRYNNENNTSDENSVQYALPVDHNPTTLYYNEAALKAAGVKVISVAAEDMEAFNANAAAKTAAGIPADATIPAKGYYRSLFPFVKASNINNGSNWVKPSASELLVFNNKIPMNWDELEDLGMLMTKTKSNVSTVTTDFGFYTEWWFNYGWSVGGDCLADITGNGDWVFTLGDDTPNYIVSEGQSYVGEYSGKTYSAGEALAFNDRLNIPRDKEVTAADDGRYLVDGNVVGIREDVTAKCEAGALTQFPSTKEAFTRFAMLAGVGGLDICPYPSAFAAAQTSSNYFFSGKVAFLIERAAYIKLIDNNSKFDWNVAPLPVYKTYTEPTDPHCDTAAKTGIRAGHSDGVALAIRKASRVKDKAYVALEWLTGAKGQSVWAQNGFVPNCISLKDNYETGSSLRANNIGVMIDALNYERAGDWLYMKDKAWIDVWSKPLNNQVRYGTLTLDSFFNTYIKEANAILKGY